MSPAPFLGIMALLTVAPSAFAAADTGRGTTGRYAPAKARIDSYDALLKQAAQWGERYDPRLSAQDVADLAEWLNRNFYRFDK